MILIKGLQVNSCYMLADLKRLTTDKSYYDFEAGCKLDYTATRECVFEMFNEGGSRSDIFYFQ